MRRRSMKCKFFRKQFTCRYFGFRCKDEEKTLFYISQCSPNRFLFLFFRIALALYWSGWFVAMMISETGTGNSFIDLRYLTTWTEVVSGVYFILSLILSIVGVSRRRLSNRLEHGFVKILRGATWVFYSIASVFQLVSFTVYWSRTYHHTTTTATTATTATTSTHAPPLPRECKMHPFNIHLHLVSTALILTDVFVSAFPIRILHFVYPSLGFTSYVLMTIVLYGTGNPNVTSPFPGYVTVSACFINNGTENLVSEWEESQPIANDLSVGFTCLGPILAQLILFFIYLLRINVAKICCKSDSDCSLDVVHNSAIANYRDNAAFDTSVEVGQQFNPKPIDYF